MTWTAPLPMTSPPVARTSPARPTGVRRVLLESAYAASAFFVALPAFILAVTLISLGLGTLVLVGGVLFLALGANVARGVARFERWRMRELLGLAAPSPSYSCPRREDGFWRRSLTPLRDAQSWLDLVWSLVSLVTGTVAFVVVVVWWSVAAGGLSYWLWQRFLPVDQPDNTTLAELIGLGEGRGPEIWLYLALGVAALASLPWAVRLAATTHAGLARALLCSRAELQGEVRRVEDSRAAARSAEAESLRRLERDIHDGPQQRLVRLTMDLGRARRQLGEDPARAGETLDAALAQARDAVDELRSLSRGIAPPLLVDRGLVAALEEMMVRSEVPVTSRLELPAGPGALAPHVETAVYFVVAEALTNVNKHSGAAAASVRVREEEGQVRVTVTDDGTGGAHPSKGLGLAGLQQRLAGVDGWLEVDSPAGGPTVLEARIPR